MKTIFPAGSRTLRRFLTTSRAPPPPPQVHQKLIKFDTENGKQVELKAVYEDSSPSGSPVGTVIALHGSPGSHNDFKYIRSQLDDMGIRFIGVNYPGFSHTEGYIGQQFGNVERQRYSDALLNELNVHGKTVTMGHSRGCENALITATSRNADGLIMINPTGLRVHKGSRPKGMLETVIYMHEKLPKRFGDQILVQLIKSAGFKVQDGAEAVTMIRTVLKLDFERILEYILKLNEMKTKTLFVFGGRDHVVEKEIVFEALQKYEGLQHFDFKNEISVEEMARILEALKKNKGTSVFVANDNHFQNKKRADLIAAAAQTMLMT